MCDYVLRVSYKNEKPEDKKYYECDAHELEGKIKDLYSREQVLRIGVFQNQYAKVRTEEWKHITHSITTPAEVVP